MRRIPLVRAYLRLVNPPERDDDPALIAPPPPPDALGAGAEARRPAALRRSAGSD